MINRDIRRNLKRIKKEIKELKKRYKRMEFRPCQNDAELRKKDDDLRELIYKIDTLEKKQDRFILNSGRLDQRG
jgi:hypothetical protein